MQDEDGNHFPRMGGFDNLNSIHSALTLKGMIARLSRAIFLMNLSFHESEVWIHGGKQSGMSLRLLNLKKIQWQYYSSF